MAKIEYHDYLKLESILGSQNPISTQVGRKAHEEHLFIVVHQTYELWFKQILVELESVLEIFNQKRIDDSQMGLMVARLERVVEIQKVLLDQINVLETMTPLDFLDFRDLLYPASGFQSFQFRMVENRLGLKADARLAYNNLPYHRHLTATQMQTVQKVENEPSLFTCVERWLERTPFLQMDGFDFWQTYQKAVQKMFARERELAGQNSMLTEEDKKRVFTQIQNTEDTFAALFDEKKYEKLRSEGHWRLSYRAVHAALLIALYRDRPVLQMPFRLITCLLNIDEMLTQWRYRHALMAKRMLGSKVGTGGSSGAQYLKDATDKHKIFTDFFQLATFFIPRSELPDLPEPIKKQLGFVYEM